ncbi:glycosyl hydrolase family 99 protein [Nitzschia inconspicua]|uniref:Glycosyl hydrolase family 99 protein n=1 Tax=Nitzschia inconspicua TaxID=303405 RepID=A0A9K3L0D2_9STRA|nr:glycosyl hydrolase family 99 protein [Nitzschia inconspicua]
MHTLYRYEDSDEEKVDERSTAGNRTAESWHDEPEAPSIPDRSTRSIGSYMYNLQYHAVDGDSIETEKMGQRYHERKYGVPEYWYHEAQSPPPSEHDSRKHTVLIILIILLTFLLGFVVGRLTWVTPAKIAQITVISANTEPPTSDTTDLPKTVPPFTGDGETIPVSSAPPRQTEPSSPIPPATSTPPMDFELTSPPDSSSALSGELTVGVYYYPWYKDDFHRGDGYVRNQLSPPQEPWLGEYDDTNPIIIAKHLEWSRQANIGLWVTSWWGQGSREDVTLKTAILRHPELNSHQFAIFYETTGRIKESEGFSTQRVEPDVAYLCQEYFDHPNYFRLDGKPVLFVYLTRKLDMNQKLPEVLQLMRQAATNAGCGDVYIVGDHVFQGPPETEDLYPPLSMLNAVTNYDVYGSMGGKGGYVGQDGVTRYYNQQRRWRDLAHNSDCHFIPAVSPGYNDLGVRPEKAHPPLSRKLSATSPHGSLFEAALRQARTLVDGPTTQNLLMVNSFNEFHEDTQIEPVIGPTTTLPESLTNGLEYDGYGELYLDILRKETTVV